MPKYKLPNEIARSTQRAIQYNLSLPMSKRASYKDDNGKRVPGTGMRTARRIASGSVDEDQIRLMIAWFARHGESPKEKEARRDKTSKASIAFALWGGRAGERWAKAQLRKIERQRSNGKG